MEGAGSSKGARSSKQENRRGGHGTRPRAQDLSPDQEETKSWRHLFTNPVPDQWTENCWAIALLCLMEALLTLVGLGGVSLNVNEFMSGVKNKSGVTWLSNIRKALDYLIDPGIPKTGQVGKRCHRFMITDYDYVQSNDDQDVQERVPLKLLAKQPLVGILFVTKGLCDLKGKEIYTPPTKYDKNVQKHMVTITGYGTDEKGNHYWEIRNSWGSEYADKGYARIARQVTSKHDESVFLGYVEMSMEKASKS